MQLFLYSLMPVDCVCFSGSVTRLDGVEEPSTDSQLTNSLSAVSNTVDIPSADIEQEILSAAVSVACGRHDAAVRVSTASGRESVVDASCIRTVAEVASTDDWPDDAFRVRSRRRKDNVSRPIRGVCEECGRCFRHSASFRSHTRRHAADRRRLCDDVSAAAGKISTGNVSSSTKFRRLMCDACGLRGRNVAAFARHMRAYHPSTLGIDSTATGNLQLLSGGSRIF